MKNNLVIYTTVFSMLVSACSPKSNTVIVEKPASDQVKTEAFGYQQYQALLNADNANIALAESLLNLFQNENPEMVAELRKKIENGSLIVEEENTHWDDAKNSLIIGSSSLSTDKLLVESTLNLNLTEVERSSNFKQQLTVKVAGLVHSMALQNILKTYDEQIKIDSREIAKDVVLKISKTKPELLIKIDKTKSIKDRSEQIEQISLYLKQADQLFLNYDISDAGAAHIVLYTAVAGALAAELVKKPSVKALIEDVTQVVNEAKELSEKAKNVVALAKAVKQHGEELSANAKIMVKSFESIHTKIKKMTDDIKPMTGEDKKNARRMLNDLVNGRTPGEVSVPESAQKGFFENDHGLKADADRFSLAAQQTSKSLDSILSTTVALTDALNIKLSPKVQNAIKTAQKVSAGIKAAQAIASGFSSGGIMGAMATFSGGPATMALAAFGGGLGGGGPDPAIMAELAGIKQTLTEIKAMQQEILERQKQTMTMIKELALMVEEQHRTEMRTLFDIRDEVGRLKSAVSGLDQEKFYSCQLMTDYVNSQDTEDLQFMNVANIDFIKKKISEATSTQDQLSDFLNNSSSSNFKECQQELTKAFVADSPKFNRADWIETSSTGIPLKDGGRIKDAFFTPALNHLMVATHGKEARWEKLALHLPVLDMTSLIQKKSHYLDQPAAGTPDLMKLQNLTATNRLEKYVSAILILQPYLSIDLDIWNKSLTDALKFSLTDRARNRMINPLTESLKRIKMAIAQEAILSGEPLLPSLSKEWAKIVNETFDCKDSMGSLENYCYLRENSIMRSNLLTYVLIQKIGISGDSEQAKSERKTKYEALLANPEVLAQTLLVKANRIKNDKGVFKLALTDLPIIDDKDANIYVELPASDILAKGELQYTEAMARMVKLEHKVADELVKNTSVVKQQANFAEALFAQ